MGWTWSEVCRLNTMANRLHIRIRGHDQGFSRVTERAVRSLRSLDGSFVDWFKQAFQDSAALHDSTQQRQVDHYNHTGAQPACGLQSERRSELAHQNAPPA